MRPALRAAAKGGFAHNDRTAQRAFGGVVGGVNGRVFQPDNQVIQVFGDPCGQLLTLPGSIVFARETQSLVRISSYTRSRPCQPHLHKQRVEGAMEALRSLSASCPLAYSWESRSRCAQHLAFSTSRGE